MTRAPTGQPGWRPVMMAAGGPARRGCQRGAARRAAGAGREAMRRNRSAASAAGIPAAVTNSGRAEDLRMAGTAWVAVRNLDLATLITGMPNSAWLCAAQAGRPLGSRSA